MGKYAYPVEKVWISDGILVEYSAEPVDDRWVTLWRISYRKVGVPLQPRPL